MIQLGWILRLKTFYKQLRLVIALFFYVLAIGLTPASAIGLGDIPLHSYLNDPLSASVE